ncbi:hypothetical protein VKT23_014289 [Stygiomarasmius scandens]|uniref:Uncharacterized protein n=1 Tax=Marasmiellus scandens TaxID=2682957 RepID=A0ABR1J5X5_9AGAR
MIDVLERSRHAGNNAIPSSEKAATSPLPRAHLQTLYSSPSPLKLSTSTPFNVSSPSRGPHEFHRWM